ncbi:hypothetical protein BRD00_02445 [Halobacteriales archaeon QS_8_69_26]|nr:MAG: hypothetical protein BRD00_02445 [Halobacteriales archaeon QS_8_69_26]
MLNVPSSPEGSGVVEAVHPSGSETPAPVGSDPVPTAPVRNGDPMDPFGVKRWRPACESLAQG